jgi:hypothetical protein
MYGSGNTGAKAAGYIHVTARIALRDDADG